eukprot:5326212-Amphidinium_carterae.1
MHLVVKAAYDILQVCSRPKVCLPVCLRNLMRILSSPCMHPSSFVDHSHHCCSTSRPPAKLFGFPVPFTSTKTGALDLLVAAEVPAQVEPEVVLSALLAAAVAVASAQR